ncbi:MAG: hypothetical protein ACYC27_07895 [Armatimonadota bacterium]
MRYLYGVLIFSVLVSCAAFADIGDLSYIAGSPSTETGIKHVLMAPIDGAAKIVQESGKYCLKTDIQSHNPYIYFDINRKMLLEFGYPPYEVEITVEYFDAGNDVFAIQYDAPGTSTNSHYKEIAVTKTDSRQWKKAVFHIKDGQFGNGQQGVSDLRISAGTEGDECISSVTVKCIKANSSRVNNVMPEQKLVARKWAVVPMRSVVIVRSGKLSSAEQIAIDKLCERFEYLGAKKPVIADSLPPAKAMSRGKDYLIVGKVTRNSIKDYPAAGKLLKQLASNKVKFKVDQGFVISSSKMPNGANVVVAAGLGTQGSTYAIASLQTRLWADGKKLALHLDKQNYIDTPALEQRELYINIGYGLSRNRITPDTWTVDDWKDYIDKLILAKYNAWSFYLWGDSELAHPESTINKEKNIQVHKAIQEAIKYSHKRGIKVGYHLSPTMIPEDILAKHPELKSTLEYPANGIICMSKPLSMELSVQAYGNEVEWFKECDFFPIWFYDCGGCFCEQCKVPEQQLSTLIQQVKVFDDIIHKKNPSAVTQVVTWAIWRYERMHKYSIRDRFMQQMDEMFRDRKDKVVFSDGIYIDPGLEPLFPLIRKHGYTAKSFLYQTNIENGQPFVMPMTRYLEKWIRESVKADTMQIHLMRMECTTKYPQDFVGGYLFWNPTAKGNDALELYSNYEIGESSAGRNLNQALVDMDDFAWFGYQGHGASIERGERINNIIKSAVKSLPAKHKADLEWLSATGEGYRILGKAVDARDMEDQQLLDTVTEEYKQTLMKSPTFKSHVDTDAWLSLFQRWHVGYFQQGWSSNIF